MLRCVGLGPRGILPKPHKTKRARMGAESAEPVSTATRAVFLSYASQDAGASQRVCQSLRASGIEVCIPGLD